MPYIIVDEFKCYWEFNRFEEAHEAQQELYPFARVIENDWDSSTTWIPAEWIDNDSAPDDEQESEEPGIYYDDEWRSYYYDWKWFIIYTPF